MYSAELYKEDLLELKRAVRAEAPALAGKLEAVNKLFLALKRECEDYQILPGVSHIALKLMNLLTEMEATWNRRRMKRRGNRFWICISRCVLL